MEVIFAPFLFILFLVLIAFATWATLYPVYLLATLVVGVVKGIFQNFRISESLDKDLEDDTKQFMAFLLSALVLIIVSDNSGWSVIEYGVLLGTAIFFFQIWRQTGGTFTLPRIKWKVTTPIKSDYRVTDLGKPVGEMTQAEKRAAAEKIVQTMLDQAQNQQKNKTN
jgi:hypothetical protein